MAPPVRRHTDDATVILRSRTDPPAFAELYDRHAAALHAYLHRRLGPSTADDLVAETFIVAFARRHAYDLERLDARPWLYGIASRLISRHRRSEGRMLRAFARTGVDPVADAAHGAERTLDRVHAHGHGPALAGALAALKPPDREVLLLIAWAELSYEEVAAALEIPVGTVRSRLNRARRQLREALPHLDPTFTEQETTDDHH
jgi:RNA polymerase sigma factor (sigma-70 family)